MIDPTEAEIAAIQAASDAAGQYIESIPSTDILTWTQDQWLGLIECAVTGYTDSMREQQVPF